MINKFRAWQKQNPDWQLICDLPEADSLYIQWDEITNRERMRWIGTYRRDAREAFEEFSIKKCKVVKKFLNSDLELCDEWPQGEAMTVFLTGVQRRP